MLTRIGSPITKQDLDAAEKTIGKLPAACRAFLLASNGGTTENDAIAFFGIDTTPKVVGPALTSGDGEDFPPETIAIAQLAIDKLPNVDVDDQPQGPLLIAHRGPHAGKIFFWNDARWTPFLLARNEKNKGPLEAMFAKAYADYFKKLAPVAASFEALRELAGGKLVTARPPISEAELAAFEDRAEIKLPRELRSFLLASNGGKLEGGKRFELEPRVRGTITWLFGLHRKVVQPPDIRKEHDRARKRIPKGTVPIAAGTGTLFLLDPKGRLLAFEVFIDSWDQGLPIVGYVMNGRDQTNAPNIALIADKAPIIPKRLYQPFRGVKCDDEAIHAELAMQWFVKGWRAAAGPKLCKLPATIVLHDQNDDAAAVVKL